MIKITKSHNKNSFIEKVFSVKNNYCNNKIYKVITFLGIKFKFRNNLKELEKELNNKFEYILTLNEENEYKLCKYMPKEKYKEYLKDWFYQRVGYELNIENPITYNEKIQWLKLYESTEAKTRLADKYLVRDWVKEKIGEEYLIPLLGVWDNFDEINFDKLPNSFVLKCNHGCAYNIIVDDKSNFDKNFAKEKINKWLREDYSYKFGLEMHYSNINKKIIAEKYIENNNKDLYDYKFWCFNGKVHYIQFLSERNLSGLKMSFYDRNWNLMDFVYSYPRHDHLIEKPQNLEKLIELSEKLAEGFSHVRVDFYLLDDGGIKFGEMTFTPMSGVCNWNVPEADKKLGDLLKIKKGNI